MNGDVRRGGAGLGGDGFARLRLGEGAPADVDADHHDHQDQQDREKNQQFPHSMIVHARGDGGGPSPISMLPSARESAGLLLSAPASRRKLLARNEKPVGDRFSQETLRSLVNVMPSTNRQQPGRR